jgi:hypothetical protein
MALTPASGFPYYISLLGEEDFFDLFQSRQAFDLLSSLSEEQSTYRYEPGKWSIKQILGHITDHERIMMYRALRFSRKDATPLAGYDQNLLVENARFDELQYADLLMDFQHVRNSTISFIQSLEIKFSSLRGYWLKVSQLTTFTTVLKLRTLIRLLASIL